MWDSVWNPHWGHLRDKHIYPKIWYDMLVHIICIVSMYDNTVFDTGIYEDMGVSPFTCHFQGPCFREMHGTVWLQWKSLDLRGQLWWYLNHKGLVLENENTLESRLIIIFPSSNTLYRNFLLSPLLFFFSLTGNLQRNPHPHQRSVQNCLQ